MSGQKRNVRDARQSQQTGEGRKQTPRKKKRKSQRESGYRACGLSHMFQLIWLTSSSLCEESVNRVAFRLLFLRKHTGLHAALSQWPQPGTVVYSQTTVFRYHCSPPNNRPLHIPAHSQVLQTAFWAWLLHLPRIILLACVSAWSSTS